MSTSKNNPDKRAANRGGRKDYDVLARYKTMGFWTPKSNRKAGKR